MAENGERPFAYAYKDMDYDSFMVDFENSKGFHTQESRKTLEEELKLICIFGLKDDLKEGAAESIKQAQEGGIIVRMCSGDNLFTAKHCALQAGILTEEDMHNREHCMTGDAFMHAIGGL